MYKHFSCQNTGESSTARRAYTRISLARTFRGHRLPLGWNGPSQEAPPGWTCRETVH